MRVKQMYLLISIFILCSASTAYTQFMSDDYKSLQFGVGENYFQNNEKRAIIRISYTSGNLIPKLFHQIGLNSSFSVPYGNGGFHNTLFFNVGKGVHYKVFTILSSFGPNISCYRVYNSTAITASDYMIVNDDNLHFQLGLNGNISILLQPLSKFGMGIELFYNQYSTGRIYGSTFVLHFSNMNK